MVLCLAAGKLLSWPPSSQAPQIDSVSLVFLWHQVRAGCLPQKDFHAPLLLRRTEGAR